MHVAIDGSKAVERARRDLVARDRLVEGELVHTQQEDCDNRRELSDIDRRSPSSDSMLEFDHAADLASHRGHRVHRPEYGRGLLREVRALERRAFDVVGAQEQSPESRGDDLQVEELVAGLRHGRDRLGQRVGQVARIDAVYEAGRPRVAPQSTIRGRAPPPNRGPRAVHDANAVAGH